MRTILISMTLLMTVILSVSLGVVCAYAAVQGILTAFGRHSQSQEEPAPAVLTQEATADQGLSAALSES